MSYYNSNSLTFVDYNKYKEFDISVKLLSILYLFNICVHSICFCYLLT